MSKPRFFTGVQASGTLTLGNYCGVIQPILALQKDYEVIIMIADLHALTVSKKDFDYWQKSQEMAALLYACGLNQNCKIFIQSQVQEHLELTWLLAPFVTVSELNNMIQYKEKKKNKETGNLALLSYPVLMAADIFLYDSDLVIVGQDQSQHLELVAGIAQKFNNFYGKKLLKIPQFTIPILGAKIMSLQNPVKKMSKSERDYIALLDNQEVVKKKITTATTDSENKIYYDTEKKPGISNLLTIYALLSNKKINEAEKEMVGLNYHQFKLKIIDLLNKKLGKIQEKYNYYLPKVREILEKNNSCLQDLTEKKLKEIKKELKILRKKKTCCTNIKTPNKIIVLVRYTIALIFLLAWLFVFASPLEWWSESTIFFVLTMFPLAFWLLTKGYKDKPRKIRKQDFINSLFSVIFLSVLGVCFKSSFLGSIFKI